MKREMKLLLSIAALVWSVSCWGQLQVSAPDTLNYDELKSFLARNSQAHVASATNGNIVVRLHKEIFYNIRESENDTYEANAVLNQVGNFMRQFPESRIYAVGYADRGTGNYQLNQMYANRRAIQFRHDLIRKYGISPERILTESNGDVVQPFRDNDRNRCVQITGLGYLALNGATPLAAVTAEQTAAYYRQQFEDERDRRYEEERSRHAKEPNRVDTIVLSHVDTLWIAQEQDTLKPERPFGLNKEHLWHNWFFTVGFGPGIFQGDHNIDAVWADRLYPVLNFGAGKWIIPALGLRAMVNLDWVHNYYNANLNYPNPLANYYGEFVHGASPSEPYSERPWLYRMDYRSWNFHADVMVNFSSLIWRPYNRRIWNLIGYAGVGCIATWDHGNRDWFNYATSWNVGIMNSFRVAEHFEINLDFHLKKFSDDYNCFRQGRSKDGITNLTIGGTWYFTKRGF